MCENPGGTLPPLADAHGKMSNLYQVLKKDEDPIPKRQTSFSIFQEMISNSSSVLKNKTILDQKRFHQAAFSEKGVKLAEKLKRKLTRQEKCEKRRAPKLESTEQLHPLHSKT